MAERRGGENLTFSEAFERCKNLELGGFDDWYLPMIQQFKAISQYLEKHRWDEVSLNGSYWMYRVTILDFNNKYITVGNKFSSDSEGDDESSGIFFDASWERAFNSVFESDVQRNILCVRDIK